MSVAYGESGVIPVADARQSRQEALAAGSAGLLVHGERPLNAELPPAALGGEVTPTERFFRRNHFPIPDLSAEDWRLRVGGLVREPVELGLAHLRGMGRQSAVVTLECAGNGRTLFSSPVAGERWVLGAVSSARWTGVPLADVLDLAGIAPGSREVVFRGADGGMVEGVDEPVRFERSLTVGDALESGALLVYEMNGEPLPARYGYPVRLVVPGWYAVASVKWLTEIELTDEPFTGYFQDNHYVYEWQRDGAQVREPVGLQRIRALITEPANGGAAPAGSVLTVRGVAWSGAAAVTRVEVAAGTASWRDAELVGEPQSSGWQRWELAVAGLPPGPSRIRARAYDAAGNDQLTEPEWNYRGYGGNFVHEVAVTLGLAGQLRPAAGRVPARPCLALPGRRVTR
jgi:DMSO/TMAO reductase YedYZ molybdopterin-dependent catalytic subunit